MWRVDIFNTYLHNVQVEKYLDAETCKNRRRLSKMSIRKVNVAVAMVRTIAYVISYLFFRRVWTRKISRQWFWLVCAMNFQNEKEGFPDICFVSRLACCSSIVLLIMNFDENKNWLIIHVALKLRNYVFILKKA